MATNTRVRITKICQYSIRVQTLGDIPQSFTIPRIKFKFTLPWGGSYQLMRTQFPLRLAYAVSVNKSQGQGYEKLLLDSTTQPFQHGHGYVAFSRVYDNKNIKVLCKDCNIVDGALTIENVVYNELINNIL